MGARGELFLDEQRTLDRFQRYFRPETRASYSSWLASLPLPEAPPKALFRKRVSNPRLAAQAILTRPNELNVRFSFPYEMRRAICTNHHGYKL